MTASSEKAVDIKGTLRSPAEQCSYNELSRGRGDTTALEMTGADIPAHCEDVIHE
jgi:hypothetical protein